MYGIMGHELFFFFFASVSGLCCCVRCAFVSSVLRSKVFIGGQNIAGEVGILSPLVCLDILLTSMK